MKLSTILPFVLFALLFQFRLGAQNLDSIKYEYDNYVQEKKAKASKKFTYSQFAIALRYRDTIGLNSQQIDALYIEVDKLKKLKKSHYDSLKVSLDTRSVESRRTSEILTNTQYTLMLRLKNHTKARSIMNKDWEELTQRNLTDSLNATQVRGYIYEYYLMRESTYDRYRHDLMHQNAAVRELYLNRPRILKKLAKSRRSPNNDTLGENLDGN